MHLQSWHVCPHRLYHIFDIIIIVVVIIIIIIISLLQGIYTYIPETNNVHREYIVATILLLLFMVSISLIPAFALLFFYISTFQSMCAVPSMAVFCSFLTSWFPGVLLSYFLNDFEIVPVAPIITGITLAFTFQMHSISIARYLYLLLLLLLLNGQYKELCQFGNVSRSAECYVIVV
jgi:hypothetical protein